MQVSFFFESGKLFWNDSRIFRMIVQKGWLTRAPLGQWLEAFQMHVHHVERSVPKLAEAQTFAMWIQCFWACIEQGSSITQCMTHAIKFHDNPIKPQVLFRSSCPRGTKKLEDEKEYAQTQVHYMRRLHVHIQCLECQCHLLRLTWTGD